MPPKEVIAIAKTLRPYDIGIVKLREHKTWRDERMTGCSFEINAYGLYGMGNSWEEALRSAGWKG